MLYRPEAFEPLTDESWDENRVREAIRAIVADTDEAFDPDQLWPADDWDAWETPLPLTSLYVGAAGVVWALDALRRRGPAETRLDLRAAATRALEARNETPPVRASLFSGDSGLLVVAWQLTRSSDLADALLDLVRENAANEANEVMFGAPGTMLAARAMHGWTGEDRWADAWRESAEELWRRRSPDGLWTQRLWGEDTRDLGPPHGLVGNVLALLQGEASSLQNGTPSLRERPRACSPPPLFSRPVSPTGRRATPAASWARTGRSAFSGATAAPA